MRGILWGVTIVGMAACADDPGKGDVETDLEDVNPNSLTYSSLVTVGEGGGAASAWYFTHAT